MRGHEGSGRRAVVFRCPSIAELVGGEPDEAEIEPSDPVESCRVANPIGPKGEGEAKHDRPPTEPGPEPDGGGHGEDHEEIDREEPQRGDDRETPGADEGMVDAEEARSDRDQRPHGEERDDRGHEAPEPCRDPRTDRTLVLQGRVVREPVCVAPDDEEHRYHLDEPRQPVGPFCEFEDVGESECAIRFDVDGRGEPMADDHDDERGRPIEVDRPISGRWGLRREVADTRHQGRAYGLGRRRAMSVQLQAASCEMRPGRVPSVADGGFPVKAHRRESAPRRGRFEGCEFACKPDPVVDGHLSGTNIAAGLARSTRDVAGGPPCPCSTLLRMGFAKPSRSPGALVVSYTTVSPLPVRRSIPRAAAEPEVPRTGRP